MNDEARELLVAAALRGHPQARGRLHTENSDCAMGLFHLDAHEGDRVAALACMAGLDRRFVECRRAAFERYGISEAEWTDIVNRNNGGAPYAAPQDFLTIARKVGHGDEGAN